MNTCMPAETAPITSTSLKNQGKASKEANIDEIVALFNQCFSDSYNTRLIKGGEEPEYIPADNQVSYHRIILTRDYVASALHEVAHWCVAGEARRLQQDYGYWYAADGRSEQEQAEFEKVEVKPQALEWLFSIACGMPFRVSADNLNAKLGASEPFELAIVNQARDYCLRGVNERAEQFIQALFQFYNKDESFSVFDIEHYSLEKIS